MLICKSLAFLLFCETLTFESVPVYSTKFVEIPSPIMTTSSTNMVNIRLRGTYTLPHLLLLLLQALCPFEI